MKKLLLCSAILLAAPAASAQMMVLGEGAPQSCYESAKFGDMGSHSAIRTCSDALKGALNRRDEAATFVNRGILRMRRSDLKPAAEDFTAALRINPDLPEAHINRGVALFQMGDVQASLTAYNTAIKLDTVHMAEVLFNRAIVHEQLNNPRAAYTDMTAALALKPGWDIAEDFLSRYEVRPAASSAGS